MKYVGRKVRVFLEGGWSCSGTLEVFSTDLELIVASPTGLISIPSSKVCAIQLSLEAPSVYQESQTSIVPPDVQPVTVEASTHQPAQGQSMFVGVPSGRDRGDTELMRRLKAVSKGEESSDNNHYGSILPNDMLIGGEEDSQDLSISFSPISGFDREDGRSEYDKMPIKLEGA